MHGPEPDDGVAPHGGPLAGDLGHQAGQQLGFGAPGRIGDRGDESCHVAVGGHGLVLDGLVLRGLSGVPDQGDHPVLGERVGRSRRSLTYSAGASAASAASAITPR